MARAALLLALAACLALGARAQLPEALENRTPPAWLNHLAVVYNYTDDSGDAYATGYVNNGNFSYTYLEDDGPLTDAGRYLSWECIGNGTHHALLELTQTLPNGTVTVQRMCELGIVSLRDGWMKWAWSESECPAEWDQEYYNEILISDQEFNPCGEPAPEEATFLSTTTTTDAGATLPADDLTAAVDGAVAEVVEGAAAEDAAADVAAAAAGQPTA